jgi:hypothetical protein
MKYSDCVSLALGLRHVMRMRHIAIFGLPGSTLFFHIISQTARLSKEKFVEHEMYFEFLYEFFCETFLILRKTERDMIKHVYRSARTVPVILVIF